MINLEKSIPQAIKKSLKVEGKNPYTRVMIVFLLIGAFLRFYQLDGFVTFLGDQGRDAIVMYRLITFDHLPAIGAPSSVGMVFLGPFYYYLMAPWLLMSQFSPIGPAIGVALLSLVSILAGYFFVRDMFGEKVSLLVVIMMVFHNVLVSLSRFSWNPNLLPYTTLFFVYFFVKAVKTHKMRFFVLTGAFFSISMQFHYVFLALLVPMFFWLVSYGYTQRSNIVLIIKNIAAMIAAFTAFTAPLILFDLKNNFLNLKNFIGVFSGSEGETSKNVYEVLTTYVALNEHTFLVNTSQLVAGLIFLALAVMCAFFVNKKSRDIAIVTSMFILGLIVTAFFTENKFPHYFGALYPLYFMFLAYLASEYIWVKKRAVFIGLGIMIFVAMQAPTYSFLYGTPNNQIQRSINIAQVIRDNVDKDIYQVASLPNKYNDHTYRYFLEMWGNKPLEKDTLEKADELFVVCEEKCKPIGDAQWDIAYFAPTKVAGTWEKEGVTIYKLVR